MAYGQRSSVIGVTRKRLPPGHTAGIALEANGEENEFSISGIYNLEMVSIRLVVEPADVVVKS